MRRSAMATFISGAVGISTLSVKTASARMVGAWDFSQTSGPNGDRFQRQWFHHRHAGFGGKVANLLSGSAAGLPVAESRHLMGSKISSSLSMAVGS